jgi:hypothetical protein
MLALARPQLTMGQLPAFPDFAPLDISHRDTIDEALAAEPPEVSELNFAEIFAWHSVRNTRISDLDGAVCLLVTRHGKRCFCPPLRAREPAAAMRRMLLWLREQGEEGFVYGLTGRQAADAEATGELVAEEDMDNADYVYRTQDLILLPGHKYDGKRNHIHNFVRGYEFNYAGHRSPVHTRGHRFSTPVVRRARPHRPAGAGSRGSGRPRASTPLPRPTGDRRHHQGRRSH